MNKRIISFLLAAALLTGLCSAAFAAEGESIQVTDMIGREVSIVPGSYTRVVCIGAGALRLYCYIGDPALLAGVEDIDNRTLAERPKMFDAVARPLRRRRAECAGSRGGKNPLLRSGYRHFGI